MKRLRLFVALAALSATAGIVAAQNTNELPTGGSGAHKSDWEREQERRNWKEGEVPLPAYPKAEGLIEFTAGPDSRFRFFIDPASLSLSADGVVRYTLIARSASGFANVSYEGMRCSPASYKVYALGHEGRWTLRESEWRAIRGGSVQRWHAELSADFFCPKSGSILSADEGLDALRKGGHPGRAAKAGF